MMCSSVSASVSIVCARFICVCVVHLCVCVVHLCVCVWFICVCVCVCVCVVHLCVCVCVCVFMVRPPALPVPVDIPDANVIGSSYPTPTPVLPPIPPCSPDTPTSDGDESGAPLVPPPVWVYMLRRGTRDKG